MFRHAHAHAIVLIVCSNTVACSNSNAPRPGDASLDSPTVDSALDSAQNTSDAIAPHADAAVDGAADGSQSHADGGAVFLPDARADVAATDGAVPAMRRAVQFSLRYEHGCAVLNDGTIWCWGRNAEGQLGDGTTISRNRPVQVQGMVGRRARQVAAGHYHTCAVFEDGGLMCWGSNRWAQLGDGTQASRPAAAAVDFPAGMQVAQVASGVYHTCARMRDGTVWCWGLDGAVGATGTGTEADYVVRPRQTLGLNNIVHLEASGLSCAINAAQEMYCWGDGSETRRTPRLFTARSGRIADVTIHADEYCVLLEGGDFQCFGGLRPRQGSGATRLGRPAGTHTCVVIGDELRCWGHNGTGALGRGDSVGTDELVFATEAPTNIVAVESGPSRTFVLSEDGRIASWGSNQSGALGSGVPGAVSLTRTWVSLPE